MEKRALEPDSRSVGSVYVAAPGGPNLAAVARHSGLSESLVDGLHASVEPCRLVLGFQRWLSPILGNYQNRSICLRTRGPRLQVPAGSVGIGGAQTGDPIVSRRAAGADRPHAVEVIRSDAGASGFATRHGDGVRFVPQGREYML